MDNKKIVICAGPGIRIFTREQEQGKLFRYNEKLEYYLKYIRKKG